ncbi:MAG: hypothetical protein ACK46A_11350 [Akkermansiaceae bacterium]|jgi:hypothetical protein
MKSMYPYGELEKMAVWPVIDKLVGDLAENKDIIEQTDRRYIVGYLIKELAAASLLTNEALMK